MLFKLISVIAIIATTTLAQTGVGPRDVCVFSSTIACTGTALCCTNALPGHCCANVPSTFGFSVSYANLPLNSGGQVWTSPNCTAGAIRTFANGPGTRCWTGGGTRAASVGWNVGVSRGPDTNDATVTAGECSTPDVYTYPVDGETKSIRIPGNNDERVAEIAKITKFFEEEDFEALAAYEPAEVKSN